MLGHKGIYHLETTQHIHVKPAAKHHSALTFPRSVMQLFSSMPHESWCYKFHSPKTP